jgi:hypothetical protein
MNCEFGGMKEVLVAYFNILSRHLPRGTEENHENLRIASQYPSRDSNMAPLEYKPEALLP